MTSIVSERRFVGASGNALAADVGGDERAPAIVLLHGGGQTRHSWRQAQLELIASGYYVVSVDARGHGDSDWIEDADYSTETQVGDIRAIAHAIGKPPALVGASMGGMNALIACGEDPRLASALVLVDVAPRLERAGVERIRQFMKARPEGFRSLDEAADAIAAYNPLRPRPANPNGLRKNLRLHDDGRWRWHWDPRMFSDDSHDKLPGLTQRMLGAASHITIPTLLVRGRESDVVSEQGVAELREHIHHMQFSDIEGAGHMIAGDRNDSFTSAVHGFLARVLPAPATQG
jgi:pimeloyl-ACP methyl ester carboxylesterase